MPKIGLMLALSLVALRKESVDRNVLVEKTGSSRTKSLSARRAWIEIWMHWRKRRTAKSLSARRAWIEIDADHAQDILTAVALRKESVDRNPVVPAELTTLVKSLSARRAWIEMEELSDPAKLAEGRSPQGERG